MSVGKDGRVLLKCFAGCRPENIVSLIGLTLADLFEKKTGGRPLHSPRRNGATPQHGGCTLAQYAKAKRLRLELLRALGLADISYNHAPAIRIPYRDGSGQERAVRIRRTLHKESNGQDLRFVWRRGSTLMLYGLDRLGDARAQQYIVLNEGESDCHTCWHYGIPAVGLPGANSYKEAWAAHLADIATIYVVIEPDQGGAAVLACLAHASIRDRVRLIRLSGVKDVSDLHVADPDQFLARWRAAVHASEPWSTYREHQVREQASTAWSQCAALAQAVNLLDAFDASLVRHGVVGERRAARLIFLAGVSRLLPRPVSIAVKGPSSGGKSHIVQQVLDHFPADAYYALSAMSERALAYSEEPLKHRMLVLFEAAGMTGDFASYLIRSLLSEGCVRYETVEKTKEGMRPRLIEREGPTGLITTTTAVTLHPENETRLLSIPVTDTPDQTRQILQALSQDPSERLEDDLTAWRALQTWLETAESRVVVPYARRLAEQIPPVAIRLRRDFTTLLTLIKSHTILHQVTRDRDVAGRVIATLADYQAVRDLVLDLFDVAVQASVSPTVRETVAAVARLNGPSKQPVTLGAVAKALALDKGTVSRRVKVAVNEGYLQNLETKRNQPMKLVSGDPLPESLPLLPEPTSLDPSCSVALLREGSTSPPLSPTGNPLETGREVLDL